MINRFHFFEEGNRLNARFSSKKSNGAEATNLLERTRNQRKSIRLVKQCAKEAKLKLRNFRTNKRMELYFDVYRSRKNLCYVSKGWNDPGFRIGEIVDINKTRLDFKEKFYEIFRICSKGLISVNLSNEADENLCINLEIGIYKDGFNAKVLKDAVLILTNALERINKIL